MPGVDPVELARLVQQNSTGILGWINGLAGGALGRMAIFALNIMPYISASIIIQLMTTVSPHLEQLKKEGEQGRKKMNQYTRYGTVLLAALQAYGIAVGLEGQGGVVLDPGWFFRARTVITLTGGTVFLMWLGEQITSRGIGNGISLIIFAGIVAGLPSGDRPYARARPHRADVDLRHSRHHRDGAGRHRLHRVHGAGAAANSGPVSQAPGRRPDDAGRQLASAAQAQHFGRHSADLRLLAAAAADHGGEFHARGRGPSG